MTDLAVTDFGLRVQPMVHVADLAASLDFYAALGGTHVFGSRDGDWALVRFGDTCFSLLAHPPSALNPEPVELQFVSEAPLDVVMAQVEIAMPHAIERGIGDEAFGRMAQLRTPDGLVVKLLELDRGLIG